MRTTGGDVMRTLRNVTVLAGMLMLVMALGCADEPVVEPRDTPATTDTGPLAIPTDVPPTTDAGEPVRVVLTDFGIEMPNTLPAGPTLFTVSNEGAVEHNFEIEGQGIEETFETHLLPEEVRTLQVDLRPGSYRVYCPVEDHPERGMAMTLTVTQRQTAPGSDL
jgi:uncharacterized cupredoxin-like copper-binding protein